MGVRGIPGLDSTAASSTAPAGGGVGGWPTVVIVQLPSIHPTTIIVMTR